MFVLMAALAAVRDTFPGDLFLADRWQDVDVPALGGTLAFANALGVVWAAAAITVGVAALLVLRDRWLEGGLVILTLVPRGLEVVVRVNFGTTTSRQSSARTAAPPPPKIHRRGVAITAFVRYY